MIKPIPLILGLLLVGIATLILLNPSLTEPLDNFAYDIQLRTRFHSQDVLSNTPVAIIDIDDKSLAVEGHWPWSRKKLATLLELLQKNGAVVNAFDMFFPEKENNLAITFAEILKHQHLLTTALAELLKKTEAYFDTDADFAKSLAKTDSILSIGFLPHPQTQNILPSPLLKLTSEQNHDLQIIKGRGYISSIPLLQNAAKKGGLINVFPDSDGIIRRAPLLMNYQGDLYPALSLQAVLSFLGEKITLVTALYNKTHQLEGFMIGSQTIPTDEKGQVLIPFVGKSFSFPYYSATDVFHNNLPKDALLGKILFIGTTGTGLGDMHATAIESPFPGVEIQATLANGLLLNNFSQKPAWAYGASFVLTLLLGLLASFLFPYLGPKILAFIILLFPPTLIILDNWLWQKTSLILSILMPLITVLAIAILNLGYGYLFETRRREHIKEIFGQYVPEKHIDEMLESRGSYGLKGENREMSVLFADIRNFTGISEGLPPTDLREMLNTFLTPMTEIIFEHYGTIDKYVGDLIMAFWGAPLNDENHALHAIQSALAMQARLIDIRPLLKEHQWPEFHIGIGINSGIMTVGDMGSRFRRNYTVLGDAVNLASRAESLTKFYGVDIIVTEHTMKNHDQFVFRKLDRVKVKGKARPTELYEVICVAAELTSALNEELILYHQALDFYFQQQWDQAEIQMKQLHIANPHKKIYSLYCERIAEYKTISPPKDWDGVYVFLTK
jgi:adenylate cyclase